MKGNEKIMKSKNKVILKALSLVLSITLVGGCLAGCGDKKEENSDTIKISWWRNSGHDKTFMKEKIAEFNETIGKERGIELVYEHKDGDLEQMIDLAYTTEQAPDLYNTWKISQRAEKGEIAALDDIPGMDKLIEKFGKNALEGRLKYQGKVYDLPCTTGTYGLIYNVEMFKAAGIVDENGDAKPPVTWDDVVEYAKKLTNTQKGEYGFIMPGKWSGFYGTDINMAASAINGIVDGYNPKDGTFDHTGPQLITKKYIHMLKDGSVVPGFEGIDNDPARARFGQGKIGMKIAGSYDVAVLKDQFPAKIEWAVAPLPVADTNEMGMQYSSADGLFSVNANSVERIGAENIVAIYEFFTSDEILTEQYEQGIKIPIDYNLVKDVELPNADDMNVKNWAKFASFTQYSQCPPPSRKSETSGTKSIIESVNELLIDKASDEAVDKVFDELTEVKNAGIAKYEEIHPEYDSSLYIIKDWKLMR